MRTGILPSLLVIAACLAAVPAAAQGTGGFGGNGLQKPGSKPSATKDTSTAPPDAVPGAKARPDSVTPASKGSTDLPPTEALFDAVNRGDIVSARDAISRGADLDSTNLLGLTPIELSVDLGRNDISFLLLSLRGASSGARSAQPPQQAATAANTAVQTAAERRAARRGIAAAASVTRTAPPPTGQTPTVYAGNSGGAPVPAAGFLGFDSHN
jgi:hypothetical protein